MRLLLIGVFLVLSSCSWQKPRAPVGPQVSKSDQSGETPLIKPGRPDSAGRKAPIKPGPVGETPLPDTSSSGTLDSPAAGPDTVQTVSDTAAAEMAKEKPKEKKPEIPLICAANPGSAEGSGKTGVYILEGEVRCDYGLLHFETNRAVWDRQENQVTCDGSMKVLLREMILTAERGGYRKEDAMVWAEGRVRGVDTTETYEFSSGYMTYDREGRFMHLTRRPVLRRFYTPDSAGRIVKDKALRDTMEIRADTIIYSDSMSTAEAHRKVEITRGNLLITCTDAFFDEVSQKITLVGNPQVKLKDNVMKGDSMLLSLNGESLKSIAFKGNATGDYTGNMRDSVKSGSNEKYHVEGDSLFMKFDKEALEFMEIFRHGLATYYQVSRPDKVNNMKGDFLRLNFVDEKIDSAVVTGRAESIYFHFDGGKFKGENQASGDTLSFSFKNGKISLINIMGNAKGTYLGQPSGKKTAEDSTAVEEKPAVK